MADTAQDSGAWEQAVRLKDAGWPDVGLGVSPVAVVAGRVCVRDVVEKLEREVVLAR